MIDNLLTRSENRRLNLIYLLAQEPEPVVLADLSKRLEASVRVLKDDLAFFRNEVDDFIIETSHDGVSLYFKKYKGLKTISQNILANSTFYQILEMAFLYEGISANEIAKKLFISSSTLYRSIHDINNRLRDRGIQIETNPCRIVGDEQSIRYFAYLYFFERYARYEWPFKEFNEQVIDDFLMIFIEFTNNPTSFASLTTLKIVFIINLIRYKNGHLIKTPFLDNKIYDMKNNLKQFEDIFKALEENIEIEITDEFINQVFYAYLQDDYFLTYDNFKQKAKVHEDTAVQLDFLENFLENISSTYDIPLVNKKELVVTMHDSTLLEYQEPRSGYILYNQHGHFVKMIEKEFPSLYTDLYNGASQYRDIVNARDTEKGKHFLIYTIFIHWKNLIPNLRNKYKKIKTLVISDRHVSHAYMLMDFLNQEYPQQLETEIFPKFRLNKESLESMPHDLIVTNFPFPELDTKKLVYIQNVPSHKDLAKIQLAISEIIEQHTLN